MNIAIGADHGGYELKTGIASALAAKGIKVLDFGTNSTEACDYSSIGIEVAKSVANQKADFGVVICKSGIGMSIAANKVKGIRAALCASVEDASSARRHNHANVIAISGVKTAAEVAIEMVFTFITTEPEGGRHARRVAIINDFEESSCSNKEIH